MPFHRFSQGVLRDHPKALPTICVGGKRDIYFCPACYGVRHTVILCSPIIFDLIAALSPINPSYRHKGTKHNVLSTKGATFIPCDPL